MALQQHVDPPALGGRYVFFSVAALMFASSTDNLRFSPYGVWYAPILPVSRG